MRELRDAWLGLRSDIEDLYQTIEDDPDLSTDDKASHRRSVDDVLVEVDSALVSLPAE